MLTAAVRLKGVIARWNKPPPKGASFAERFPSASRTWHPTRNGTLRPKDVWAHSGKPVWWRCTRGPDHEWRISPDGRSTTKCPFCAGKRVSVTNSLATKHPEIAAQWHPDRNGPRRPEDFAAWSNKRSWWRCAAGHEWWTSIDRRVAGTGCPSCAGRRVSPETSLAARAPELAAEWHPTRNGKLLPSDVTRGSSKAVWWSCATHPEHVWRTTVASRSAGRRCPFCAGIRASATNSLAVRRPDLAAEWHAKRNGPLRPSDVLTGSERKVWWKCKDGPDHEWRAEILRRANGNGCPFCRGLRVSVTNSLATMQPALAREWHPRRNGKLAPRDVTCGSERRVWWKCPKGPDHVWQGVVNNRVRARRLGWRGCPFCSGRRTARSDSLATVFPKVAREWDVARNGALTPKDVLPGSTLVVWWRCSLGHRWRAPVLSRMYRRGGCPACQEGPTPRPRPAD